MDILQPIVLQSLAKRVYEQNKSLGHWDIERPKSMIKMLVLSEVFEAYEAYRKGSRFSALPLMEGSDLLPWYATYVKGSLEEEFADICIRILDYSGHIEATSRLVPGGGVFSPKDDHDRFLNLIWVINQYLFDQPFIVFRHVVSLAEISARGLIYTSISEPTTDGCTIKFIDAGSGKQRRIGGDFIVTEICD